VQLSNTINYLKQRFGNRSVLFLSGFITSEYPDYGSATVRQRLPNGNTTYMEGRVVYYLYRGRLICLLSERRFLP